jgi:hypothetical protein
MGPMPLQAPVPQLSVDPRASHDFIERAMACGASGGSVGPLLYRGDQGAPCCSNKPGSRPPLPHPSEDLVIETRPRLQQKSLKPALLAVPDQPRPPRFEGIQVRHGEPI